MLTPLFDLGQSPTRTTACCWCKVRWLNLVSKTMLYLVKLAISENRSEGRSIWPSSAIVGCRGVLDEQSKISLLLRYDR
jgi:hypothetical protein